MVQGRLWISLGIPELLKFLFILQYLEAWFLEFIWYILLLVCVWCFWSSFGVYWWCWAFLNLESSILLSKFYANYSACMQCRWASELFLQNLDPDSLINSFTLSIVVVSVWGYFHPMFVFGPTNSMFNLVLDVSLPMLVVLLLFIWYSGNYATIICFTKLEMICLFWFWTVSKQLTVPSLIFVMPFSLNC